MIAALQGGAPIGPELLIIVLFTGIFALPALIASGLIYRDANRRNSSHTIAWTIGAFVGGLVVWILYFFVRDEVGSGGAPISRS